MYYNEQDYQAENDDYTMMKYLEIMADKQRVEKASKYAEKQVEEIKKQLSNYKKVSKKKGGK